MIYSALRQEYPDFWHLSTSITSSSSRVCICTHPYRCLFSEIQDLESRHSHLFPAAFIHSPPLHTIHPIPPQIPLRRSLALSSPPTPSGSFAPLHLSDSHFQPLGQMLSSDFSSCSSCSLRTHEQSLGQLSLNPSFALPRRGCHPINPSLLYAMDGRPPTNKETMRSSVCHW